MTKVFSKNKNQFFDDYAHHPTEISSILDGVKKVYNNRKIITIFELHRYSRVMSLKDAFSKSFKEVRFSFNVPYLSSGRKKQIKF